MYCANCGNDAGQARFCPNCGAEVQVLGTKYNTNNVENFNLISAYKSMLNLMDVADEVNIGLRY